jgi:hypothetical protein
LTALPVITDVVTIDGYTQPGSNPANGGPATILIELDGSLAGPGTSGLYFWLGSGNSRVRGLAINRMSLNGITIDSVGGVQVDGNYLGTDTAGANPLPNGQTGVYIVQAGSGNLVGGTTPAERNILSGNSLDGAYVERTSNTSIKGNYVGTDFTGIVSLPNQRNGVRIVYNSHTSTVGGATAPERNIISGNVDDGVFLSNNVTGTALRGNYIGTDVNGTSTLANGGAGVDLSNNANNNTIGGTAASERNIISGNSQSGVDITGSTGNTVSGNYIGTDVNGTADLGNSNHGLYLYTSANTNTIGGDHRR